MSDPKDKRIIFAECGCGICEEHASESQRNDTLKFQGWPLLKPSSPEDKHE